MSTLSKREKVLLYICVLIAIISGMGVFYYLMIEKVLVLNSDIDLLTKQIQQMHSHMPDEVNLQVKRELLLEGIKELEGRLYTDAEMNPYKFGIWIKDLLLENGLNITKYQTIENNNSIFLEFFISGDALDFIEFLESVSLAEKYWSIPFMVINADKSNGQIEAVFRITYGIMNENI